MSFDHHFTTTNARPRPKIDQVVGRSHGVFVVFDDDDGVPQVPKVLQGVHQTIIISGVQTDRRLVQNVQYANQASTDLTGQSNPLAFATGERWSGAVEHEVFQTDVQQKAKAITDFFQRFGGDVLFRVVQSQATEELNRVFDRKVANFRQR